MLKPVLSWVFEVCFSYCTTFYRKVKISDPYFESLADFLLFYAKIFLTAFSFCCKIIFDVKCIGFTWCRSEGFVKNQTYRMTMLYDFYGELLTERQQEFYDLYYNEDLSLAEIAENYGITRQGVRDIIVRAETYLQEVEEKTGLIARYHTMQTALESMQETTANIQRLNENAIRHRGLEELCQELEAALSVLGKD